MSDVNLDWERDERLGLPEIVYGESKSAEQLQRIVAQYAAAARSLLVTRLQPDKAAALPVPAGAYDPVGRTLLVEHAARPQRRGSVALVYAGTSDLPVVREAERTLDYLGVAHVAFGDVGVAGIHRLTAVLPEIRRQDVVLCFAGFEGALASVLAGLVGRPVIGVPVSVGYGVSAGGRAALRSMLGSCAHGLVAVNIDNGTGAALAACRILSIDRP